MGLVHETVEAASAANAIWLSAPDRYISVNYPALTDGACGNVPEAQVDQTEI